MSAAPRRGPKPGGARSGGPRPAAGKSGGARAGGPKSGGAKSAGARSSAPRSSAPKATGPGVKSSGLAGGRATGKAAPKGAARGGLTSSAAPRGSARSAAPTRAPRPGAPRRGPGGSDGPPPRRVDRGLGGDQVEGRQAVRELLLAGTRKVREIWVSTEIDESEIIGDICELAQQMRIPVREVSRNKLMAEARTEAPQGVLAKAAGLPEADFEDLLRGRPGEAAPFLVALDGVTDPGNLGAVLRSAECAGATGVVLPRHRAVHVTPTVTKAAAGAIEYLPMALVGGLPAAIARARALGVWVVGLDGVSERTLFELPELGTEPIMLVLGAEGTGLSRLVRERCDEVVAIPMKGRVASLNVSAAGVLAVYEVARRRMAH